MESKKRKSGGSHTESIDIMPCTHTPNWNSDDQETDREEGGSDVMELKEQLPTQRHIDMKEKANGHGKLHGVKSGKIAEKETVVRHDKKQCENTTNEAGPAYSKDINRIKSGQKAVKHDKTLCEDTTHETEPAYSTDTRRIKSDQQMNGESVNKKKRNADQKAKVVRHDKKLCEKIINDEGPAYSKDTKRNKSGQQMKGAALNEMKTNAGQETKDCKRIKTQSGQENNKVIRTCSKDKEKNESVEHKKDNNQETRSDTRNKKTKQSQNEQSCSSKCEDQKHLKTPSEKKKNDAVITFSTDQENHEQVEHKKEKSRTLKKITVRTPILFEKGISIFGKFVCHLMILVMVLCRVNSNESTQNATWQLNNTHVVFGESVALNCSLDTNICKNDSTRRWTKGTYQEFLIPNGKSINPNKYREVLSQDCYTSYLIINNFNKDDMDVEYTFAYSTQEFSRELKLERSMYTSYPENETIASEIHCRNHNLSFILKLVDINPVPKCSMVVMNDTISSEGNVHNTSEFFSNSEYRFHYPLLHDYNKGTIQAWCSFGTKNVTVFDGFFKCDDPRNLEKENTSASLIAILIVVVLILTIMLVIIICRRKRKTDEYKNVACHPAKSTTSQNGGVQNGIGNYKT